jgi:predicted Fe-Mo cluster-binding NifX family protein
MRIAVMADRLGTDALVPAVYEESSAMLIVETDDESVVFAMEKPAGLSEYAAAMTRYDCEAVVCTPRIGQEAFEPLAAACITRYDGVGLSVMEAARRALSSRLELVREYEGGPGCASGGDCECGQDHGEDED